MTRFDDLPEVDTQHIRARLMPTRRGLVRGAMGAAVAAALGGLNVVNGTTQRAYAYFTDWTNASTGPCAPATTRAATPRRVPSAAPPPPATTGPAAGVTATAPATASAGTRRRRR